MPHDEAAWMIAPFYQRLKPKQLRGRVLVWHCSNDHCIDSTRCRQKSDAPTRSGETDRATLRMVATCSGHIDRSVERRGDNPAGVVELTARKARFLAMPAIVRIRLISTKRLADILVPLLPQD